MRAYLLAIALLCGPAFALAPAPSDADAQQAHAKGQCGSLGPGTGLGADGKGWIVSMLPGTHEFRGAVVTVAKQTSVSMDAGRPYYITATGGPLEWKVPGSEWGPISKLFLYPPVSGQRTDGRGG